MANLVTKSGGLFRNSGGSLANDSAGCSGCGCSIADCFCGQSSPGMTVAITASPCPSCLDNRCGMALTAGNFNPTGTYCISSGLGTSPFCIWQQTYFGVVTGSLLVASSTHTPGATDCFDPLNASCDGLQITVRGSNDRTQLHAAGGTGTCPAGQFAWSAVVSFVNPTYGTFCPHYTGSGYTYFLATGASACSGGCPNNFSLGAASYLGNSASTGSNLAAPPCWPLAGSSQGAPCLDMGPPAVISDVSITMGCGMSPGIAMAPAMASPSIVTASPASPTSPSSAMTSDPSAWGPPLWGQLHARPKSFIASTAGRASEQQWLNLFYSQIPCGPCRTHWSAIVTKTPQDLTSQASYFKWTVAAHNAVNQLLGKPQMPLATAANLWGYA